MSKPIIEVKNLSKVYQMGVIGGTSVREEIERLWDRVRGKAQAPRKGEFWALNDVSFEVQPGQIVGIIGRNGAGKSTLLKILSRITKQTYGEIRLRGRVASLLEVGTGFHPDLTGRENVFLNGAILGMTKAEIRGKLDEIVAFAEVEKFIDTPVKRYSSGMYVRLAFAVAAHLEPEILIVDEVLAVGDAAFQKKCIGKMRDVSQGGRTVLFVSHNLAAVAQLCNRGVVLERGQVLIASDAQQAVAKYISLGKANAGSMEWTDPAEAPGDDRLRLRSVRVLQQGRTTAVVDINQPSEFEMTFEVLKHSKNVLAGFSFYAADETCLFATVDWRPNRLSPGVYCKRLTVPAHTLAEGSISLLAQAIFYDPDIRSAYVPNALRFDAVESDHPLAVRGHYRGNWPGLVRPNLPWSEAVHVAQVTTEPEPVAALI